MNKFFCFLISFFIFTTVRAQLPVGVTVDEYGDTLIDHSTPELAEDIKPSGIATHEIVYGNFYVETPEPDTANPESIHFVKGFTCWMKFIALSKEEICFTIHSLDSAEGWNKHSSDHYLAFVVYQFNGTGAELSQAIRTNKIQPVRIGGEWKSSGYNKLTDGGLSPFETDTFASGEWQSGFVKPIYPKKGAQYYLCVGYEDWDERSPLISINKFTVCFNSACAPPKLTLRDLAFENGNLKGNYPALDKAAALLKKNPKLTVAINGYATDTTDEENNIRISREHAEAVYNYLIAKGVKNDQLSFEGYGSKNYIFRPFPQQKEWAKAVNRRVELEFTLN